jgi:NTE family protein
VVLVELTPGTRADAPRRTRDIRHRSLEIAFAAPLQRELAAIEDLRTLCRQSGLFRPDICRRLRHLRLHRVSARDAVEDLAQASPADLGWNFLSRLAEAGREAAEAWLAEVTPPAVRAWAPRR